MNYYTHNITKETSAFGLPGSATSRKKIKNYSYSLTDRIGKGFSSIVYKGQNDDSSKKFFCATILMFCSFILFS